MVLPIDGQPWFFSRNDRTVLARGRSFLFLGDILAELIAEANARKREAYTGNDKPRDS